MISGVKARRFEAPEGRAGMSAQGLLGEVKKQIPFRVYGKGPVIDLLRTMGHPVTKKSPLEVVDAYRSDESGEIVCEIRFKEGAAISAALTNLKLDITHPLYRKVKDYRGEVVAELAAGEKSSGDINRPGFRVGDLYKR